MSSILRKSLFSLRQFRRNTLVASVTVFSAGLGCSTASTANGAAAAAVAPTPPAVAVNGYSQMRVGSVGQFTVAVAGLSSSAVTWKVNGITGGSAATGTISTLGVFTAPATLPSPNTVTVSAVSVASPAVLGTFPVAILNPQPVQTSTTATESGTSNSFLVDVRGSGFVQGAEIQVEGVPQTTTFISANEVQATYATPPGAPSWTLSVSVVNPAPGASSTSGAMVQFQIFLAALPAAARLLDQATFGPTLNDIQHVQTIGLDPYITEQMNLAPTLLADVSNPPPAVCVNTITPCEQSEWWAEALTAPDQLRQRVAFALSEIFVVSTNSDNAAAIIPFQNILAKDAFGNFSTLLNDVTLSTAMGNYLNMLNSLKPGNGQIANENYARENMQLFTIGLNQLNGDGTPKLDAAGNMIPTFTQNQVQAFARAYTGWTYASSTGGSPTHFPNGTANFDAPMAAVESAHDETSKALLNGTTLPANQTAEQDLAGALANLFANSNLPPFVCRQLIQHLVSSNPSPAYVSRVSAVFVNNGSGVRGDLSAVVRAILEDSEARAGDTDATMNGGHLREPILYIANVMRGLGYVNTDPTGYYGNLSNYVGGLGEKPYSSPSVFNFFPPNYVIPSTAVNAPEFSLENTASAILRLTLADQLVNNHLSSFSVNLSATSALGLMAANPGNLVDSLGVIFMHGQMPANMRTAIVNHITTLTDPAERVRVATYLVITSSQYKIEH